MNDSKAIVEITHSPDTLPATVQLGSVTVEGPRQLVETATSVATELASVIKKQGLASRIKGRDFVRCEGWTTLAAMIGIVPREIAVTENEDECLRTRPSGR